MRWGNFTDVFTYHATYLHISRLLDFDKTAVRGSHAFSIYKGNILGSKDLIIQALEVTLRDGDTLTLRRAMWIVENVAAPNAQNHLTANSFSQQCLNSTPTSSLTLTATPATSSDHPQRRP